MKKIQIIVDSAQLDCVEGILNDNTVHHFTVSELREFGLRVTPATAFRGQAQSTRFKDRVTVEAIVTAEALRDVVAALRRAVTPAQQPEVYVYPVESVDLTAQPKSETLIAAGVN